MSTEAIDAAIRTLDLPEVASWRVEAGPDAGGDDAVWVWIILQDEGVDSATRTRLRNRIRQVVGKVAEPAHPWVYVRFRTSTEVETS